MSSTEFIKLFLRCVSVVFALFLILVLGITFWPVFLLLILVAAFLWAWEDYVA